MPVTIIVDALWGDAGKGKFSAHLSIEANAAVCVRAGIGPNAGHSVYAGTSVIKTRLLPLGFLNKSTRLMIGSGVAITPSILLDEIALTRTRSRLTVDYRCPVIEARHVWNERQDRIMRRIDSTMSGCGAARADYVMRRGRRASEVRSLKSLTGDVAAKCNEAAAVGQEVVVESSQATLLSLYLSDRYPYTTSDNCTTAAFLDDVGLSWRHLKRVVMLVKCLPTAVGAGPLPNEMPRREIIRRGLVEFATNSGRPRRRVNRIPMALLRYAAMVNGPTEVALTHCDQYDPSVTGKTRRADVSRRIWSLVAAVEKTCRVPVTYLDTGKGLQSIIRLGG
jgi:adenylosuccinate synthase